MVVSLGTGQLASDFCISKIGKTSETRKCNLSNDLSYVHFEIKSFFFLTAFPFLTGENVEVDVNLTLDGSPSRVSVSERVTRVSERLVRG